MARSTLPAHWRGRMTVLDPTCGTGRLLLAAAQVASERGCNIRLVGIELADALACVARAALPQADIITGDATDLMRSMHPDVVLLNPPYRGRMRQPIEGDLERLQSLESSLGSRLGPYTDPATGFVLLSEAVLKEGGQLGAIVPVSIVSARDAAAARAHLARHCITRSIVSAPAPFEAQVNTVSIVLKKRPEPIDAQCNWSSKLATAACVPSVSLPGDALIGDIADVTADFRDEYYALKGHIVECADCPDAHPVLTSGLIDPGVSLHGTHPARVHGERWSAPGVIATRKEDTDAKLGAVIKQRLVPKVLVATQTPVIEAVVDAQGEFLPLTPVIRIVPRDPADLWRIGASLLAPQASALALHRHFGAGRSPAALRLRAVDIAALPLLESSREAACILQELAGGGGDLRIAASQAADLWGGLQGKASEALLDWWWSRLPERCRSSNTPGPK
ncbi:MAG: N-6 DNA methylase [Phycisphaerales bacterium]|nr:N-6 DNA methylase [Phycisphaerales bacterium]